MLCKRIDFIKVIVHFVNEGQEKFLCIWSPETGIAKVFDKGKFLVLDIILHIDKFKIPLPLKTILSNPDFLANL